MAKSPYIYDPEKKTFTIRMNAGVWPAMQQDPLVAVMGEHPAFARRRFIMRTVIVVLAVLAALLLFAAFFRDTLREASNPETQSHLSANGL